MACGGAAVIGALVAALMAISSALAPQLIPIVPFSSATRGEALPAPWHEVMLPQIKHADVALVADSGATVLRVHSAAAAGSAGLPLHADISVYPMLAWRWKVDRVVEKADLERRDGDDFAARVYVFFDVPLRELSFGERAKLTLARFLHGADVPSAGICYVWDNRHAPGTVAPNPYVPRIRTFVLQSGGSHAHQWRDERRDLAADFLAAFGPRRGGVPPVTGIAAGNDTDQTGESVTAWFGDFTLGARS
jgi:hypothetical protein